MKKEKLLKTMIVVVMSLILIIMTTNVFAVSEDDFYIDLTNTDLNSGSTNTNTDTNTNLNTNLNLNLNTNTNTNANNYNTNLPKTGIESNTMLVVALTVLGLTAVFAYKKVKEYKNI